MNLNEKPELGPVNQALNSSATLEQENLRLKARIAELERLVVRDTLTPLFNRRHFMDVLDRWCWRAHRYGGNYGLLFIDVDNLKTVNDSHGHPAGDAMLVAIAEALLSAVRRSDIVARIGGDEFAILLDNIPEGQLQDKAEKIVKTVGRLSVKHDKQSLKPSISAGHTMLEPGVPAVELLLRADRAMYNAKQSKCAEK